MSIFLPLHTKWSFRQRVNLWVAEIVGLTIGISVISIYALELVIRMKEATTFDYASEVIEAESLLALGERGLNLVRSFLLTGDQKHLEALQTARLEFFTQLDNIEIKISSEKGRFLIQQIKKSAKASVSAVDKILKLREQGITPSISSIQYFEKQVEPAKEEVERDFDAFITHQKNLLEQGKAETKTAASKAQFMIALISAGADALALMLSLTLIRTLTHLQHKSEEAVKIRDHVLATVSHDLKSPLSAVLMNAELLQKLIENKKINEQVQISLKCIQTITLKMQQLISELLDSSRLEAGKLPFQKDPYYLESLVESALETFMPPIVKKSIKIEKKYPNSESLIYCDELRMHQVLSNLIGNAVKFTPEGGTLILRTGIDQNGDVFFSITDTGPGIPQDQIGHVFDRFKQIRPSNHSSGAGLGLYIAKSIVLAHGGKLHVASTLGRGATFIVVLPQRLI